VQLSPFFMQEVARANLARASIIVANSRSNNTHGQSNGHTDTDIDTGTGGGGGGTVDGTHKDKDKGKAASKTPAWAAGEDDPRSRTKAPQQAPTHTTQAAQTPVKSQGSKSAPHRPEDHVGSSSNTTSNTTSSSTPHTSMLSGLVGAGRSLIGVEKPGVSAAKGVSTPQSKGGGGGGETPIVMRTTGGGGGGSSSQQSQPQTPVIRKTGEGGGGGGTNSNASTGGGGGGGVSTGGSASASGSTGGRAPSAAGGGGGGGTGLPPGVVLRSTANATVQNTQDAPPVQKTGVINQLSNFFSGK
jgi:hypothetical protein